MKYIILSISLLAATISVQAQKYVTKDGTTEFKASVDAFEPVEATSTNTTAVLDTETGEIAALIFVKSFHFKVALMEEHFNENYMDSDEHPKATFRGTLQDFDMAQLGAEAKAYNAKGSFTIKGTTKEMEVEVMLSKSGDTIKVDSDFVLAPEDFGIEIPGVVREKIAKEVNVTLDYGLTKK